VAAKREVEIGKRFGELTVTDRAPNPPNTGGCFVFVKCDCGHESRARLRALERGVSRCNRSEHFDRSREEQGLSIVGQRFGALTVVSATTDAAYKGHAQVRVKCDCGAERYAVVNHLMRGNIASCGGDAHRAIAVQAKRWTVSGRPSTYLIEAVGSGLVKIGVARDIKSRLLKLQYPCPVELRVIGISDDNVESRLHAELDAFRAHGEWFTHCPEVIDAAMALMRPVDISIMGEIGNGKRGRVRGRKYTCKRCGEKGHFAKTCARPIGADVISIS
jgi:hypothetical protein